MDFSLGTPALLFPTVSLLMLAYTNRFLTLATIIRGLHDRYKNDQNDNLLGQIANLRYRVYLIRNMQIFGVLSLLFCFPTRRSSDLPARVADLSRGVGLAAGGVGG